MAGADVTLAMPIGLPPTGTDPATHWPQLETRLNTATSANVVSVWVADEANYSGLFAMTRGMLRLVPTGGTAPDGSTATSPLLLLKPWLWDYLELRKTAAPGSILPKVISYGNVDTATVGTAIGAELAGNPRYSTLTGAERTQAQTDFLAGTIRLLVAAGTMIGRGQVDPSPPSGVPAGRRRLDLAFLGATGTPLAPAGYFELWNLIGGPRVSGHPLLTSAAPPASPASLPLEGGLRIRVRATNATSGTTVTVGGQTATDVEISPAGDAVYATAPARTAGQRDVVVSVPGQAAQTYTGALTYTADLASTARSAVLSYTIVLVELRERAEDLDANSLLDDAARGNIRYAADRARSDSVDAIEQRVMAGGGSLADPAATAPWSDSEEHLAALTTDLEKALT